MGRQNIWSCKDTRNTPQTLGTSCRICGQQNLRGRPHEACIQKEIARFEEEQRAAFASLRQQKD